MRLAAILALSALALSACKPMTDGGHDSAPPPPADAPPIPAPPPAPVLGGVELSQPVRALGTEPFWSVDITSASLEYSREDAKRGGPNSGPTVSGQTATWATTLGDGTQLGVVLTAETCSDGMSDRSYRLKAVVTVGTEVLMGCAESVSVLNTPPSP